MSRVEKATKTRCSLVLNRSLGENMCDTHIYQPNQEKFNHIKKTRVVRLISRDFGVRRTIGVFVCADAAVTIALLQHACVLWANKKEKQRLIEEMEFVHMCVGTCSFTKNSRQSQWHQASAAAATHVW